jgi:hypothetical protein
VKVVKVVKMVKMMKMVGSMNMDIFNTKEWRRRRRMWMWIHNNRYSFNTMNR